MERIKLHDKEFRIFISHEKIQQGIADVALELNKRYKGKEAPLFLSVLNGAFMFTADLMKHIEFPCEVSFIKLSSYIGTGSSGTVSEIIGLSASVEGREIIVLEDIVDTGSTVVELYDMLKSKGASDVRICTLLLKPDAYKKSLPIDYVALTIPNDFIVGYGLDYNQLGRQYKDIYVLD